MLHIPAVQLCLFGNFQLVPAMDLRPAGQPGAHIVCTVLIPFGQQVVLVPKRRARADDRHIPHKDIPQLGQLVQTGLAQKVPHAGDILLRVVQQMGGHIVRGINAHSAELEDLEMPLADAHTLLPEKHRPGRVQLDGNSQKQQQPRKAQNAAGRQQNIQQPFDPIPIHKSNFLRFLRVYRLIIAVWAAFFNCRLYPAGDICRFWREQGVLPLVFYLISRYNRQLLCSHKAYYRR